MLLCDIGNTTLHFLDNGREYKIGISEFDPKQYEADTIYYICVEPRLKEQLRSYPNWIDVTQWLELEGSYATLGVDRQLAAWYVQDGIVIDAGSAITVDIMKSGVFQGGFIYPGFYAMQQAYAGISSALDYSINFELSLDTMPLNSQDAISYAAIIPLVRHIEALAHDAKLVITGGDAEKLLRFLPAASHQPHWLFDAMKHLIETHEGTLC